MATNVTMPQLGESVTEGTVGKWLKQKGDKVAKYEPLVEIITDKVNSEIPSPAEGTLLDIRVPEGETVRVGTLLALIGEPGEALTPQPSRPSVEAPTAERERARPSDQMTMRPSDQPTTRPPDQVTTRPLRLSPVVARLAAEHNVDISQIQGTGEGGRVTKQDIEKFIAQRAAAPTPALPRAREREAERVISPLSVAPQPPPELTREAPPVQPMPQPAPTTRPITGMAEEELVPLTPMRKAIAEHMVRSVHTSPHVTTVFEVDMSKVTVHRAAHKDEFARQGADLTYTAYFAEVVARVLREQPMVNSTFGDKGIILKKAINIGIAVAIEEGLIVPVLKNADELNLLGVSKALNDLARRAREKRLHPDDVQGGTFTITNPGIGGSLFGTPIINQPQAAILGVGAIVKRPVVIDDAIAIRPMVYLSLTFDHRVLDGAGGDRFLSAVKRYLENYS